MDLDIYLHAAKEGESGKKFASFYQLLLAYNEKFNLTRGDTIRQIEEQGTQLAGPLKRDSPPVKEEHKTITPPQQEVGC